MDGEDGVRNWGDGGSSGAPSAYHSPPRRQRTPPPPPAGGPPHSSTTTMQQTPQQRRPPASSLANYTLLAAGRRTGKTSFLRLLLDTAVVSPTASTDQLGSVARFVQGAPSSTSHVRLCTLDVLPDARTAPITLELIDTPAFELADEDASEKVCSDIIRLVEGRFERTMSDDDNSPPPTPPSDNHVHLCLYFLDPDMIVPPPPTGSSPLSNTAADPRSRANSASYPGSGALHLEPPVPTHPSSRTAAHLPQADTAAIRRLSTRVNVLPVIGRADTLTDARLAAVKLAVRRDLADAGIGFGIFDDGAAPPPVHSHTHDERNLNRGRSPSVGAAQLPYAIVSPEMYGHSDGVLKAQPARHELMQQYAPAATAQNRHLQRGRFVRNFRWGVLDVLEQKHSDFVPLRSAVFQHMETLVNYTYEYLYGRYKAGEAPPMSSGQYPSSGHRQPPPPTSAHLSPYGQPSSVQAAGAHPLSPVATRLPHPDVLLHSERDVLGRPRALSTLSSTSASGKQMRGKKITVACNFCRSRKLKCDGGRPACSQCTKRDVPCDYIPHLKRRGPVTDGDGGDDADMDVDVHEPENTPPEELSDNEHPRTWDDRERERLRDRERERERERELLMDRREYAPLPPPPQRYQHPADRDRDRDDRSSLSPELERYHPPQGYGAAPPSSHHLNHHRSGDIPRLPPASPYGLSAVASAAPPPPEPQNRLYERFAQRSPIVGRSRASTFAASASTPSGEYPPSAFSRSGHGHHHNAHPHALPPIRSAAGFMDVDHPPSSARGLEQHPGMGLHEESVGRQSLPTKRRMSDVGPAPPPSALGGTPPAVQAQPVTKSGRAPGTAGSKVVACNFCRARKTKCDSVHPTCSSCARRSLPCSYVNDPSARGAGTRKYSNAAAQQQQGGTAPGSTSAGNGGNGSNGGHLRPRSPARIPSSNSSRSSSQSPSARRDNGSGTGTPYGSHGHSHHHLPRHASRSEEDGADIDELADDVDEEDYPSKRPRLAPVSTASTNSASGRGSSFERAPPPARLIPVGIPLQ